MTALRDFLAAYPLLQTSLDIVAVVIPLSMLLAFAGMGFVSGTAKILFLRRKRASFDKCARQLAFLGLVLGWLLLICGRVWLFLTQEGYAPTSLKGLLVEGSWMLLGLAVLIFSLYYALWKALEKMPVLQVVLAFAAAVQGCVAVGVSLAAARFLTAYARPDANALVLGDIFLPAWPSPLWTALMCTLPLALALAAVFGALWLRLRRKYDDYGRDHYNTMISWCAAWARNAWALLWLVLLATGALRLQAAMQAAAPTQEVVLEAARLLLWLIPALLWTMVQRSSIALRHTLTLTVALLLAMSVTLTYYLDATAF